LHKKSMLRTVETKRKLLDTFRNREKRGLGRALRHDSPVRTLLEGRLPNNKKKGRPKEM